MNRTFCKACALPVIQHEVGRTLDLAPSRAGLYLPGGGTVTEVQAALVWNKQIDPVGHETHRCPAIEQGELFNVVMLPRGSAGRS